MAQHLTDVVAMLPAGAQAALGGCPVVASSGAGLAGAVGVSQVAVAANHTAASSPPDLGSALAAVPGAPEFHLATGVGAGLADFGTPRLPIPPLTGMPTLPSLLDLPDVSDLLDLCDVSAVLAGVRAIASLSTTLRQLGGLAGPTKTVSQPASTATQHAQMITRLAHRGAQQHPTRAGHHTRDHDSSDTSPHTAGATAATTNQGAPLDTQTRPTQNPCRARAEADSGSVSLVGDGISPEHVESIFVLATRASPGSTGGQSFQAAPVRPANDITLPDPPGLRRKKTTRSNCSTEIKERLCSLEGQPTICSRSSKFGGGRPMR
ncbi:hypothetical protein [Mycobacterium marinum]|uniref:hypothetical protein n=1 Tax=Mycobacterium marinum TaxID=1781 RepID=UPI0023595B69|nr:hypothetical protein [Mycobacterium marinum]MDC8985545.1 hypothetical protein [Mycobacterium marinum]MDC9002840.1 hypothetical protein [Mycobacterium marinum]MDC9013576.1 hypothetical protein [Mycobacterium marinum]MDC9018936.1 hypothetical protein [Mycobacterium marinum]